MLTRIALLLLAFCQLSYCAPEAVHEVSLSHSKVKLYGPYVHEKGLFFHTRIESKPGWHTYYENPGESGMPVNLYFEGLYTEEEHHYPFPKRHQMGPVSNLGYENLDLLTKVTHNTKDGELNFDLEFLVCEQTCVPQSLIEKIPASRIGKAGVWPETLRKPYIRELKGHYGLQEGKFRLFVAGVQATDFVLSTAGLVSPHKASLLRTSNDTDTALEQRFKSLAMLAKGKETAGLLQTKDGPQRILLRAASQEEIQSLFQLPRALPKPDSLNAKTGFLLLLVFAFLGGLILNLMPCILPVLSLKILGLLDHANPRKEALFYSGGVISSLLFLSFLLLFFRDAGVNLGWGFQLQNPAFVLFLVYLVFLCALNLCGVFEISFSFSGIGGEENSKATSSFMLGILSTLMATPCSAPFMATALGVALQSEAVVAHSIFLFMGIGLSFPVLVLAWKPALLKFLPKPGNWMIVFKQLLSFPLFITVIWLLWVLNAQIDSNFTFLAILTLPAIAFFLFLAQIFGLSRLYARRLSFLACLLICAGSIGFVHQKSGQQEGLEILDSYASAISIEELEGKIAKGENLFVNITAKWCVTCKANELLVFSRSDFQELLKKNGMEYVVIDWTRKEESTLQFLESHGRSGVPLYLMFRKGREPVVLDQILTYESVRKVLEGG